MKKKYAALIILIIACILVVTIYHKDSIKNPTARKVFDPHAGTASSQAVQGKSPTEIKSKNEIKLITAQKSEQENSWLIKNGFPSDLVLQTTLQSPLPLTTINGRNGYSAEEIISAEQTAIQNSSQRDEAIQHLSNAARNGSIYALEALGRIYEHPFINDKIRASAYYEAAYLRGDWNEVFRPKTYQLNEQDSLISKLMAQQIINNIAKSQAASNGFSLRDERPGLNEFITLLSQTTSNSVNSTEGK